MTTTVATLPQSASRETEWARALMIGLERHGPTPIFTMLAAEMDYEPGRSS